MSKFPAQAQIREVGLRDGLQSIPGILSTLHKIEWITEAYRAGMRAIEVGSFVPAHRLPQLADTGDVLAYARTLPGLEVSVLVPNFQGAQRALDAHADLLLVPLSASHAHSLANLRKTPDEVVTEVARIRADRVSMADTVGYADPAAVHRLFEQARRIAGERFWCGHFHDTRGLALANVCAALQTGVTRFDASLAGIGGCPHAPGASGNAATEDLAFMLQSMAIETGLDITALLSLRSKLATWLSGDTLHGSLWRAGLPKTSVQGARQDRASGIPSP